METFPSCSKRNEKLVHAEINRAKKGCVRFADRRSPSTCLSLPPLLSVGSAAFSLIAPTRSSFLFPQRPSTHQLTYSARERRLLTAHTPSFYSIESTHIPTDCRFVAEMRRTDELTGGEASQSSSWIAVKFRTTVVTFVYRDGIVMKYLVIAWQKRFR